MGYIDREKRDEVLQTPVQALQAFAADNMVVETTLSHAGNGCRLEWYAEDQDEFDRGRGVRYIAVEAADEDDHPVTVSGGLDREPGWYDETDEGERVWVSHPVGANKHWVEDVDTLSYDAPLSRYTDAVNDAYEAAIRLPQEEAFVGTTSNRPCQ